MRVKRLAIAEILHLTRARALVWRSEQVLERRTAGQSFGEEGLLRACSRQLAGGGDSDQREPEGGDAGQSCDVVPEESAECWELSAADFLTVVRAQPDRNREILRILTQACSKAQALPEAAVHMSVQAGTDGQASPRMLGSKPDSSDGFDLYGQLFLVTRGLWMSIHRDQQQTSLDIMTRRDLYFFSSELHESYVPFCEDEGPVNLAAVVEFCWLVRSKLTDPRLGPRQCVYYAERDVAKRSNAIFLLAAFLVLDQGYSPADAVQVFDALGPHAFHGFRDALPGPNPFRLSLRDLLDGMAAGNHARLSCSNICVSGRDAPGLIHARLLCICAYHAETYVSLDIHI